VLTVGATGVVLRGRGEVTAVTLVTGVLVADTGVLVAETTVAVVVTVVVGVSAVCALLPDGCKLAATTAI
jgi:hypothetical protein